MTGNVTAVTHSTPMSYAGFLSRKGVHHSGANAMHELNSVITFLSQFATNTRQQNIIMTLTKDSVEAFITNYIDTWSECGKMANPEVWKDFMVRSWTWTQQMKAPKATLVMSLLKISTLKHAMVSIFITPRQSITRMTPV